jgi:hypothetical protein
MTGFSNGGTLGNFRATALWPFRVRCHALPRVALEKHISEGTCRTRFRCGFRFVLPQREQSHVPDRYGSLNTGVRLASEHL